LSALAPRENVVKNTTDLKPQISQTHEHKAPLPNTNVGLSNAASTASLNPEGSGCKRQRKRKKKHGNSQITQIGQSTQGATVANQNSQPKQTIVSPQIVNKPASESKPVAQIPNQPLQKIKQDQVVNFYNALDDDKKDDSQNKKPNVDKAEEDYWADTEK
jgi:hypothetical protein